MTERENVHSNLEQQLFSLLWSSFCNPINWLYFTLSVRYVYCKDLVARFQYMILQLLKLSVGLHV